ncbi:MAG: hypothetical protein JNK45_33090 [Myxococcales bacterium]|nr:hypothetical protein [Myxococcales bacterium]
MFLPDVNVLVDAHRVDAERHDENARWLTERATGTQPFAISELVISGFLRLVDWFDPGHATTASSPTYAGNTRSWVGSSRLLTTLLWRSTSAAPGTATTPTSRDSKA